MLSLEQALERVLTAVEPLGSEFVPLSSALGRVLAQSPSAAHDLPLFDNSAMDGYAVRAQDTTAATADRPVSLRVIGQTAAGSVFDGILAPGQCVRVFTGSALPAGSDAVVMQEDTSVQPEQSAEVQVLVSVTPWENVRFKGEDVKVGAPLGIVGQRLTAQRLGLLAAAGLSHVTVGRQPVLGLIATGSELVEPGSPLRPGQIHESNRLVLACLAAGAGARPNIYPLVSDTLEHTRQALARAFSECDAVLTSGGVSVGELDFVKSAFEANGGQLGFWRVAMKPGKPFVFGQLDRKALFGVPGNPVSAFVTFLLLVRPALLRFQQASDTALPAFPGILSEPLSNPGDRRHFVRVRMEQDGLVRLAGTQASHVLHSLGNANGLVDVAPGANWAAETKVSVLRWTD